MRVGPFIYSPGWFSTAFTVCLLGLLIWLGWWQAGRAESKLAMQSQYKSVAEDGVLRLDTHARNLDVFRFYRVEASGSFDGGHQFLLDNRTHEGKAGYHVLTPLRFDDHTAVLVNRGWVPTGASRETLPEVDVPLGELNVEGNLFPPPRVFLLGSSGYENRGWPLVVQSVEFDRMEQLIGYTLLGAVVMMAPDSPGGYTRLWKPYYGIPPQRHKAYSFQWFSLATALLIIYVAMTVRRVKAKDT